MQIQLSDRMAALAGMVTEGNRVADVGCDHAYIPIVLCQKGKIPSAVAMDLREGPLQRAREHIEACGMGDRIETRQSDGLEQLGEDEADTLLIAGMGGLLTKRILEECPLPASVTELVLAPQSEVSEVRRLVRGLAFHITDEDMVLEDGKFYPIIKAARGEEPEKVPLDPEMEDAFGPVLLQKRHPVLRQWLESELDRTNRILSHLEEEADAALPGERRISRQQELEQKKELLLAALEEMKNL